MRYVTRSHAYRFALQINDLALIVRHKSEGDFLLKIEENGDRLTTFSEAEETMYEPSNLHHVDEVNEAVIVSTVFVPVDEVNDPAQPPKPTKPLT